MRLPSIEEFSADLVSMQVAEDACWISESGAITDTSIDLLLPVRTSEQHFRLMPGPEFSPRLYRGETAFYQICVPTMFRPGISNIDRCFAIGKVIELSTLMDHHPATSPFEIGV